MKALNGYTSWVLTIGAAMLFVVAPIIWAVRVEGKVEVNKVNIGHVVDDIDEIKTGIKAILEKL